MNPRIQMGLAYLVLAGVAAICALRHESAATFGFMQVAALAAYFLGRLAERHEKR